MRFVGTEGLILKTIIWTDPEGAESVYEFSESLWVCEVWLAALVGGQAMEVGSSDCMELKEPVEASS